MLFLTPFLLVINFILWIRVSYRQANNKGFNLAMIFTLTYPGFTIIILAGQELIPFSHAWLAFFGGSTMCIWVGMYKQIFYKLKPIPVPVAPVPVTPLPDDEKTAAQHAKQTKEQSKELELDIKKLYREVPALKDRQHFLEHTANDQLTKELDKYTNNLQYATHKTDKLITKYQKCLVAMQPYIDTPNAYHYVYADLKPVLENKLKKLHKFRDDFQAFQVAFEQKAKVKVQVVLQQLHQEKTKELAIFKEKAAFAQQSYLMEQAVLEQQTKELWIEHKRLHPYTSNFEEFMEKIGDEQGRKAANTKRGYKVAVSDIKSLNKEIAKLETEMRAYGLAPKRPQLQAKSPFVVNSKEAAIQLWDSFQVYENNEEFWQQYEAVIALAKTRQQTTYIKAS